MAQLPNSLLLSVFSLDLQKRLFNFTPLPHSTFSQKW